MCYLKTLLRVSRHFDGLDLTARIAAFLGLESNQVTFHAFGEVGFEKRFVAPIDSVAEIFAEADIAAAVTIKVAKGFAGIPADGLTVFKVVDVEDVFVADKIALGTHDSGSSTGVAGHGFHAECGGDVAGKLHVHDLVVDDGVIVAIDAFAVLTGAEGGQDSFWGAVIGFNVAPAPQLFMDVNLGGVVDASVFDRAAIHAVLWSALRGVLFIEVLA